MLKKRFFFLFFVLVLSPGCFKLDPPPENPFRRPINYAVEESPSHIIATDLNQNGWLDLVVANTQSDTISILTGKNDGSFSNTRTMKVGSRPRWMVSGDFNEDKRTDLGILLNNGDSLQILLNLGGGLMTKGALYKVDRSPYSAVAEDFNLDGHLDIAIVSRFDHLLILLGDGTGQFQVGSKGDPGAIPTGIITGYFNQDRLVDFAIANNGSASSNIVLYFGKGDGGFEKGTQLSTGKNPISVLSDDFNKDGHPDLLALNGLGDSMTLFVSNKDGGYTLDQELGAEGGPVSAIAHDLNRDKILDLVVANSRSNDLSIIVGKPDGKFAYPPLNLYTGKSPFFVLKADFNLDGRIDLVVANNDNESISVLMGK
jgi:hypothetical protein